MCQCLTSAYEVEYPQFGDNVESTSPAKQYNGTFSIRALFQILQFLWFNIMSRIFFCETFSVNSVSLFHDLECN